MFADFLQRTPNQGWASKAKPIPPEKKDLQRHIKQNQSQTPPKVVTYFLQGITKQRLESKAKAIPTLTQQQIAKKNAGICDT